MEAHVGKLTATQRSGFGKIAVRKLRNQGLIPAVLYWGGRESRSLTVDPKHLQAALDPQRKANTLIDLTIAADGGGEEHLNVMLHDYQYHPVTRDLLHADFIRVELDKPVQAKIPVRTEGRAQGVQMGGLLNQVFRKIPVECTPEKIPPEIVIDVTDINIGDAVQISDISLPEGVRAMLPPEQTVVLCVGGRGGGDATESAEGEGEGAEEPAAAAS
jgi:large subunit ribosomal protein L25